MQPADLIQECLEAGLGSEPEVVVPKNNDLVSLLHGVLLKQGGWCLQMFPPVQSPMLVRDRRHSFSIASLTLVDEAARGARTQQDVRGLRERRHQFRPGALRHRNSRRHPHPAGPRPTAEGRLPDYFPAVKAESRSSFIA